MVHRPFELILDENINLSHELISMMADKRVRFMDMYSRVTISEAMSYQNLNHIFWKYVKYFEGIFREQQPDVLLMSTPPQFGVDYIMYELAKLHGVKTKVVFQTLFPNRFICLDNVPDLGHLALVAGSGEESYQLEQFRGKTQFYMRKIRFYNKSCWLSFIRNVVVGPRKFKPISLEAAVVALKDCQYFKKILKTTMVETPELNQKFVYFPLQLQPEMTTSMLGGDLYADQILALEVLHAFIPDDWEIYVKENPKQTPKQRSCWFYRRLRTFPKVKYLDVRISSEQLTKHSQFVAVVTGTAGWEALLVGKSVLSFGYSWYNSLPGAFHISDRPTLDEVIGFEADFPVLEESFNQLMNNSLPGVVDTDYNVIVEGYSEQSNVDHLIHSLGKILI